MEVASIAGGGTVVYDEESRTFSVDGALVDIARVGDWDRTGQLIWASSDTRAWFERSFGNVLAISAERVTTEPRPKLVWPWIVVATCALLLLGACSVGAVLLLMPAEEEDEPSSSASEAAEDGSASVTTRDGVTTFSRSGLMVEWPTDGWNSIPLNHGVQDDLEGFTFTTETGFPDANGNGWKPTTSVFFYDIPDGVNVDNFSGNLLSRNPPDRVEILQTPTEPGSDPLVPGLGEVYVYRGTKDLGSGEYEGMYMVHAVKGSTGVSIILEVRESVWDQVEPEFLRLLDSLEWEE